MEAKKKAEELIERYLPFVNEGVSKEFALTKAKRCAIICVDEILEIVPRYEYGQGERTDHHKWEFWQEVKQHLTNQ